MKVFWGFRAVIAAFLLAPWPAFSDGLASPAELAQVEFSPASFVVGEVVTVYARLLVGSDTWKEETVSSGFPEPGASGAQLVSLALERRSGDPLLIIKFVPWQAGPGLLPELVVGGIGIPRVRFECTSALTGTELPVSQPQLDPHGLYARLYILGGIFLVMVIAGILLVARARPWWQAIVGKWAFAKARREFDALLDELERVAAKPSGQVRTGKVAPEWAALCGGLRKFLGSRAGFDWSALTAMEVSALPLDAPTGIVVKESAEILYLGDQARFAGATGLDLKSTVAAARAMAKKLDDALATRQRRPEVPC
jgi:hypothetical protein